MSTVLVTGGAGFIGCRLAGALLVAGHDVVALDNLHPQVHPTLQRPVDLPEPVRLIVADVAAPDTSWVEILTDVRPQVVVHLAAETATGQSLTEPTRHASVNVVGAAALAEGIERSGHRVELVLLASSRAVYGDGAWRSLADGSVFYPGQRTPEMLAAGQWDHRAPDGSPAESIPVVAGETIPEPANVYAATKLAQEHVLSAWCTARDVPLSTLRLQNVYGAGQSPTNSYTGVLTFFARTALAGGTIDVYEDGEIIRDFVHVGDVVSAMVAAIERPARRLLDIGCGQIHTISEAAQTIARIAGAPEPLVSGSYRLGDVRAASCDIGAAQASLGYQPTWDLERGAGELLSWMSATMTFGLDSAER